MTGVVSIALSAIIEPTLFGMLVKNKKVWLAQIIGGAVGGAFLGIMKVVTTAFTFRFRHYVPGFREFRPHELRLGYGRHAHFRRRGRCSCLRLHRQGGSARLRAPDAPPLGSFSRLKSVALTRGVNPVQIVNEGRSID